VLNRLEALPDTQCAALCGALWLGPQPTDRLPVAVARRLEAEGVAMLFAARNEGRLFDAPRIRRMRLEGLAGIPIGRWPHNYS